HVIVERAEHAQAGFELVREQHAGRCGFLIVSEAAGASAAPAGPAPDGVVALSSVVHASGPDAGAVGSALGEAWIAESFEEAPAASRTTALPVATRAGELFRGVFLVTGGRAEEARGILETKREIKELRGQVDAERQALGRLAEETAAYETTIAHASAAIAALNADHHKHEKAIVALDAQLQHVAGERTRLEQKQDQLDRERQQAEEERDGLDCRQEEARQSIARLEGEQRAADERLTLAQRLLFEAREAADDLSRRTADAGASHAGLVERAAALATEVQRLEEAGAELESRARALATERDDITRRVDQLHVAVLEGAAQLDADVLTLETLRDEVHAADDQVTALRITADEHEGLIRTARASLEN